MHKNKQENESKRIADIIIHGIQEKKGKDILSLNLQNIRSSVSDYFIICHADSSTQVKAIADSVEEEMYKALQEDPWHKEGTENAEWIILDYVSVVVHIFKTEKRNFYGVEDLWADAEIRTYQSAG